MEELDMDYEETRLYIEKLENFRKEIVKDKKKCQAFQAKLGVYDKRGNLKPQYK